MRCNILVMGAILSLVCLMFLSIPGQADACNNGSAAFFRLNGGGCYGGAGGLGGGYCGGGGLSLGQILALQSLQNGYYGGGGINGFSGNFYTLSYSGNPFGGAINLDIDIFNRGGGRVIRDRNGRTFVFR